MSSGTLCLCSDGRPAECVRVVEAGAEVGRGVRLQHKEKATFVSDYI